MTKKQYRTYYELTDGTCYNVVIVQQENETDDEFKNRFFREVSKYICFEDLGAYKVSRIVFMGEVIHDTGWNPNNAVEYQNCRNETVWEGQFPEWEH